MLPVHTTPKAEALVSPYCQVKETVNYTNSKATSQGSHTDTIVVARLSSDSDEITKIRPVSSSNVTITAFSSATGNFTMEGNFLMAFPWSYALTLDSAEVINISYTVNDSNPGWLSAEVGTERNYDNNLPYTCGTPLTLTQETTPPPDPDPEPTTPLTKSELEDLLVKFTALWIALGLGAYVAKEFRYH